MSLTEEIAEKHNQTTYKGLINTKNKKTNGEMTVRYIIAPKVILGLSEDVYCQHMYLLDYKIAKDPTANKSPITEGEYDTTFLFTKYRFSINDSKIKCSL